MEKMKRIALYYPLGDKKSEWSGIGGSQRRLCFLFSHINPERIVPTLVIRVYGDKEKTKERLSRFVDPKCNLVVVSNNIEAFRHFLREKYDCIAYAHQMVVNLPAVYGAILAGSRRLLILVNISYSQWVFKSKLHEILMLNNVFLSNKIDCLYPKETVQLRKRFPNKDVTATPCSLPNLEDWLERSSRTKKENKMVFAGRMIDEKNPMLLLNAINLVKEELVNSEFSILICGDGPLEEEVRTRVLSGGYGESVQFMGMQDMTKVLPQAKVFFSLQENENYPSQSLLEAISCGCFCIATDCGDTRRIVKDEFGILIPKDERKLGQAIIDCMSMSDEQYEMVGVVARNFAKQNFDPQKAVEHYEHICGDLSRS